MIVQTPEQRARIDLRRWSLIFDEGCYARRIAWQVCPPINRQERQQKKYEAQMSRRLRAVLDPVYAIFDYRENTTHE